ncbi:hypothetical protein RHGRI_038555 [Rhododendron griersonianum]|uniref:Uncharacterized protein n=1 Tax=Rhododendron griersonianum TaxID=479676 RepID=A0AAV6HMY5_9ERIC|nr:hypothetical protein RHGRI_038555 [Rhododendron griersonianum]
MILDDWKRLYSNTKTNFREVAIEDGLVPMMCSSLAAYGIDLATNSKVAVSEDAIRPGENPTSPTTYSLPSPSIFMPLDTSRTLIDTWKEENFQFCLWKLKPSNGPGVIIPPPSTYFEKVFQKFGLHAIIVLLKCCHLWRFTMESYQPCSTLNHLCSGIVSVIVSFFSSMNVMKLKACIYLPVKVTAINSDHDPSRSRQLALKFEGLYLLRFDFVDVLLQVLMDGGCMLSMDGDSLRLAWRQVDCEYLFPELALILDACRGKSKIDAQDYLNKPFPLFLEETGYAKENVLQEPEAGRFLQL